MSKTANYEKNRDYSEYYSVKFIDNNYGKAPHLSIKDYLILMSILTKNLPLKNCHRIWIL